MLIFANDHERRSRRLNLQCSVAAAALRQFNVQRMRFNSDVFYTTTIDDAARDLLFLA